MDGLTLGVFSSEQELKTKFEASVAKKSEAEGITVYHRVDGGRKISLLDDDKFPERIQGYARIASICDHAYLVYPQRGALSAPDGELAVLLEAFSLPGTLEIIDGTADAAAAAASLKGTSAAGYKIDQRDGASSVLDLQGIAPRTDLPGKGTLIYIDRAFNVKGVGTVALGFVLSGSVSVHDRLRPIPGPAGVSAEVRGIQINDEDFESSGRGIRIGLSLKGVEAKDLERATWLDDGSFKLTDELKFAFFPSKFYRYPIAGRDMHLQLPGSLVPAHLQEAGPGTFAAKLQSQAPVWEGMSVAPVDLNAKTLRVAGGGKCKL